MLGFKSPKSSMCNEKLLIDIPGANVKVYRWACPAFLVTRSLKPLSTDTPPFLAPEPFGERYRVGLVLGWILMAVPLASIFNPAATVPIPSTDCPTATLLKSTVTVVGWQTGSVPVGVVVA